MVSEVEPIFSVAAVVVRTEPAVEWPMLMVLFWAPVRVVPRLRILKVVLELPVILAVEVPLNVTVPVPQVKVPLFVQLPPMLQFEVEAFIVTPEFMLTLRTADIVEEPQA